jgi:hypothetical protein
VRFYSQCVLSNVFLAPSAALRRSRLLVVQADERPYAVDGISTECPLRVNRAGINATNHSQPALVSRRGRRWLACGVATNLSRAINANSLNRDSAQQYAALASPAT